jgi:hypothetical protein
MRAPKTDRALSFVPNRKNKTMRNAIDDSVGAVSGLAVIETIVPDDRDDVEINPACKRYAML